MKKLFALVAALFLVTAAPALAACPAYPFTLTNGQTADANQVMSNFNSVLSCANGQVASFNTRTGAVTLTGTDVNTALGYTAAPVANPSFTGTANFAGSVNFAAATTLGATLTVPNGVAPTAPVTGNFWAASGLVKYYDGSTTQTLAFTSSSITGSAAKWTTARTLSFTGDATGSNSVDGSGNVATALTLATSGVSAASYGDSLNVSQVTFDAKGRATTAASTAIATMVGDSGAGGTRGFVPAPATGDATKFLRGDATFAAVPNPVKAWVRFTVSGGVVTVQASLNVSSVSRTAAGKYDITFTTTMTDANYVMSGSARRNAGSTSGMVLAEDRAQPETTSVFHLVIVNMGDTAEDPAAASVSIIGN